MAALLLSQIITPNAVLFPVPRSSGKADYTLELEDTIRIIRPDCEVVDILSGIQERNTMPSRKPGPPSKE